MITGQKTLAVSTDTTVFVDSVNFYIEISLTKVKRDLITVSNISNRLRNPTKVVTEMDRAVLNELMSSSVAAKERGRALLREATESHTMDKVMAPLVNHEKEVAALIEKTNECLSRVSFILDKISIFVPITLEEYAEAQNATWAQKKVHPFIRTASEFGTPDHHSMTLFKRTLEVEAPTVIHVGATIKPVK